MFSWPTIRISGRQEVLDFASNTARDCNSTHGTILAPTVSHIVALTRPLSCAGILTAILVSVQVDACGIEANAQVPKMAPKYVPLLQRQNDAAVDYGRQAVILYVSRMPCQ